MEATISNQIIEVLDALCEKFGIAIDWTGQNIVPYIQELMKKVIIYELWTSVTWILICLITTALCFLIAWILTKTKDFEWYEICDEIIPTIAHILNCCGIILSVVSIIVAAVQIFDIIACFTFPEKIIFNMIQSMM